MTDLPIYTILDVLDTDALIVEARHYSATGETTVYWSDGPRSSEEHMASEAQAIAEVEAVRQERIALYGTA